MISCKPLGGLGNLLFQIASTLSLANDNNDIAMFSDIGFTGGVKPHTKYNGEPINTRDIPSFYSSNIFYKLKWVDKIHDRMNIYYEPDFSYNKITYQQNLYLQGYFQSEKYFKHNREFILDTLSLPPDLKNSILSKYPYLLTDNTVSMHVRRGDFLQLNSKHPVQQLKYYQQALEHFSDKEYKFLVFSDDIKWCKDNFSDKFIFIENNTDYIDLFLMSLCNHNIIANSSFSWWGAWLNQNLDKKVIAPNEWFGVNKHLNTKDLIPKKWIRV